MNCSVDEELVAWLHPKGCVNASRPKWRSVSDKWDCDCSVSSSAPSAGEVMQLTHPEERDAIQRDPHRLKTGSMGTSWCLTRSVESPGAGAEEGHKDKQRAEAPLLWGQPETVQIVQPEEEKSVQKLHCSLSVFKESFSERQRQTFLQSLLQ